MGCCRDQECILNPRGAIFRTPFLCRTLRILLVKERQASNQVLWFMYTYPNSQRLPHRSPFPSLNPQVYYFTVLSTIVPVTTLPLFEYRILTVTSTFITQHGKFFLCSQLHKTTLDSNIRFKGQLGSCPKAVSHLSTRPPKPVSHFHRSTLPHDSSPRSSLSPLHSQNTPAQHPNSSFSPSSFSKPSLYPSSLAPTH